MHVRIVMLTSGTRGDVQPMLVLGSELRKRGHEITQGVPPNLVDFAARAGFTSVAQGPDTQEFMESPEGQRWLATGNVKAFMDELGNKMKASSLQSEDEALEACEGADMIVSGLLMEDFAIPIAEAQGIPVVLLHSAPARRTRAYPQYVVTTRQLPGPLNLLTGALFDRVWWRSTHEIINHLRTRLDLPVAKETTAAQAAARGVVELQAYSPVLVPGLDDYGPNRPLTGFLTPGPQLRAGLGEPETDPHLDEWLAAGDPPAYFGFGSMPVTDPVATLSVIARVTERLGLRALVSAGWSRIQRFDDDPRIEVVGALNHDAVLPRCRLAVHHGGAGTTAASIEAGIPTVICSVFADQPFWGARLEQLGAGAHVRFSKLDEASLEAALRRVLEPQVAERARELGDALRAEAGAASRAADIVERVAATGEPRAL